MVTMIRTMFFSAMMLCMPAVVQAEASAACGGATSEQAWVMPETDESLWQNLGARMQGCRQVPPYREYKPQGGRHYLCYYVENAQGMPMEQWVDVTAYCTHHLPALYELADAVKHAEELLVSIHSAETGDAVADELKACMEHVLGSSAHKLFPQCIYLYVLQERGAEPDRMLEALYRLAQKNYYGSQKLRAYF